MNSQINATFKFLHIYATGAQHSIWIFPLVLGHGKRLFENTAPAHALELVQTKTSGTGVMMNLYRPKGAVTIGSFALPETSPAELARRAKLVREG